MKKYIKLLVISIGNLKNLKYHTSQEKHFFLLLAVSARTEMKNI